MLKMDLREYDTDRRVHRVSFQIRLCASMVLPERGMDKQVSSWND